METYKFNGKTYKVFHLAAFGRTYKVIVTKEKYNYGGLALQVWDIDNEWNEPEPFGVLTVNLSHPWVEEDHAYVKNYSENEEWADKLAESIGGKQTEAVGHSGWVSVPLYDFSGLDIYAE